MAFDANFDILKEQFSSIEFILEDNSFEKIRVNSDNIVDLLHLLKNEAEFDFDMLSSFIAVDIQDNIELIYDLYSTTTNKSVKVSVLIDRNSAKIQSIAEVFKSAHFDECEIFDLFGVEFLDNKNLKRLFMPKEWLGNPLRKDYIQQDTRLAWNSEVKS